MRARTACVMVQMCLRSVPSHVFDVWVRTVVFGQYTSKGFSSKARYGVDGTCLLAGM